MPRKNSPAAVTHASGTRMHRPRPCDQPANKASRQIQRRGELLLDSSKCLPWQDVTANHRFMERKRTAPIDAPKPPRPPAPPAPRPMWCLPRCPAISCVGRSSLEAKSTAQPRPKVSHKGFAIRSVLFCDPAVSPTSLLRSSFSSSVTLAPTPSFLVSVSG